MPQPAKDPLLAKKEQRDPGGPQTAPAAGQGDIPAKPHLVRYRAEGTGPNMAEEPGPPVSPASAFENDIEFGLQFRGYNRAEVDSYLEAITEDYNRMCEKADALVTENEALRRAIIRLMRG